MKPLALALLAAVLPAQTAPTEFRGDISAATEWSGEMLLTGDVVVKEGAVLRIRAGTTVWIADADSLQSGWKPAQVELHVHGQLLAEGSSTAPIRLRPRSKAGDGVQTWHGVVLHGSNDQRQRTRLAFVEVASAFGGLQIPNGSPSIEDSVFLDCETGVEVGCAYRDRRFYGERGGRADPELTRCRFARCKAGLYAEGEAVPVIQRCVFYQCRDAAGCLKPGIVSHLEPPGCSLRHCAFIDCELGVSGASMVRDSIFLRTNVALRLSHYHDGIATQIDQVVFQNNLVAEAGSDIVGDYAVARAILRGDPRFRGPLEDLGTAGEALPACLQLGDGSAAKGCATAGGDLGPLPMPGAVAADDAGGGGARIPHWFAAVCEPPRGFARTGKIEAGEAIGKGWWAAVESEADGGFTLRPMVGLLTPTGLLAAWLSAAEAGDRTLLVAGDTEGFEVAVNGVTVLQEDRRRRLGALQPVKLPLRAGRNSLLVRFAGWGANPRLLLTLQGEFGSEAPPAQAAPMRLVSKAFARTRDGVFLDVTFDQPAHWGPAPGAALAQVGTGAAGAATRELGVKWLSSRKLRLGPFPGELQKQTVFVSFPGLRSVAGHAAGFDPLELRVP